MVSVNLHSLYLRMCEIVSTVTFDDIINRGERLVGILYCSQLVVQQSLEMFRATFTTSSQPMS
jgi:hypothetical protein